MPEGAERVKKRSPQKEERPRSLGAAQALSPAMDRAPLRALARTCAWGSGEGRSGSRILQALLGCYLGLFLALVIVYPLPRARLRWTFLAWEVLCAVLAWCGLYRARLRPWGPVERCLVILAACETMVALVGPFASDPFTRWWVGACFYLAAWGGVGVVLSRPDVRGRE
mgnify:FL=1